MELPRGILLGRPHLLVLCRPSSRGGARSRLPISDLVSLAATHGAPILPALQAARRSPVVPAISPASATARLWPVGPAQQAAQRSPVAPAQQTAHSPARSSAIVSARLVTHCAAQTSSIESAEQAAHRPAVSPVVWAQLSADYPASMSTNRTAWHGSVLAS